MSFSIQQSSMNTRVVEIPVPIPEKAKEPVPETKLPPTKLLKHGDKFFYHPLSSDLPPKQAPCTGLTSPVYEKEDIVYDKKANKWIMVKDSERYKYDI